jgi:hypothetical protein
MVDKVNNTIKPLKSWRRSPWVINNTQLAASVAHHFNAHGITSPDTAFTMVTYNFERLYTNINQDRLIHNLMEVLQWIFALKNSRAVKIFHRKGVAPVWQTSLPTGRITDKQCRRNYIFTMD